VLSATEAHQSGQNEQNDPISNDLEARAVLEPDMNNSGDLFFARTGMDRNRVQRTVDDALRGSDDGELFLEYRQSEAFAFDDGRLKAATFDTTQGFGLRAVAGEATGYAHATDISEEAIKRAAATVRAVASGHSGVTTGAPARTNKKLYTDLDPLQSAAFEKKVKLLEDMNAYARSKDSRVRQVSCSLSGEWQQIEIVRPGGETYRDVRPLVRIGVSVVVEQDGRQESGNYGGGGRSGYDVYLAHGRGRGVAPSPRESGVGSRSCGRDDGGPR
jgi:TldD protein